MMLSGVFESARKRSEGRTDEAIVQQCPSVDLTSVFTRKKLSFLGVMAYLKMNRTDLTMLIVAIVAVGLFWLYEWLNRR